MRAVKKETSGPSIADRLSNEYRQWLLSFLQQLRTTDVLDYDTSKKWASLLEISFIYCGMQESDLVKEEHVNKATISKWKNGLALPPATTRKTIINWIGRKAEEQLRQIENRSHQTFRAASA
jgi:hypothetical protein